MKESRLYEEIKDEGRLEGRREVRQASVLAALEEPFGHEAAAKFSDAVHAMMNLDKLGRLLRLAVRCASIKEFQRGLRAR